MPDWLQEILSGIPEDLHWTAKRRVAILSRWKDHDLRAAEQDARNGDPSSMARYDSEVGLIKAAIPKT